MKKYQAPTINVCEFVIESGFAATEVTAQTGFEIEEHNEVDM